MKCKSCGGELLEQNGKYHCQYCGATYIVKRKAPDQSEGFVVSAGVLVRYTGTQTDVVIPEGVVSVGEAAFRDNFMVKSVTFNKGVVRIEKEAFSGCSNLTVIKDYGGVNYIGDDAFSRSGLLEVTIGENVQVLGRTCFSRCPKLSVVNYNPKKNLKLVKTFTGCESLKTVNMDSHYFFPSFTVALNVKNNPTNKRPTFADAFSMTPYFSIIQQEYMDKYKKGVCPECGGHISKGLFHSKCDLCGIDYRN